MSVCIRLARAGRKHIPFYYVNVLDKHERRDGAAVERLGFYDPENKEATQRFRVDIDRVTYWLKNGARPSETVGSLLKKAGVAVPAEKKAEARKNKKKRVLSAGVKPRTKKRTASSKGKSARGNAGGAADGKK